MADEKIKPKTIREYLLGRISDEKMLGEIEDLLFTDDEFCTEVELAEDKLINEYTFGKLSAEDTKTFESIVKNNPDLKVKTLFTQSLKEKASEPRLEEKTSFFDSIKTFFSKPLYSGAFAILLIAVVFSLFILQTPDEIAQLKNIYQTERPIETRISDFKHAPFVAERSEQTDETNKNKLRLIENKLLEAVENNPKAENRHALGVFYLTQKKYTDSIRELKKATELDEKNAKLHNDLGSAYFEFARNSNEEKRSENITAANEAFSEAIELNENLLEALFNKSMALEKLNLPKMAKESWEQYLKKDSSSKWADEARKRLKNLNQKESTEKTKEDILEEFLQAYRANNFQRATQIHNETKGTFKHDSVLLQLLNRYLVAKKEPDPETAKETINALNYIGDDEKKNHSDFFVSDIALFYSKINRQQIESFLKAQELLTEGYSLILESEYGRAIIKFEQSKELCLENGNKFGADIAELWIAHVLPDLGKIEESRSRLKSLIKRARKHNYPVLIPTALNWLGVGYFRQNRFSEAINNYKRSLQISENTDNFFGVHYAASFLSNDYSELGELRSSLEYLVKATRPKGSYFVSSGRSWRNLFISADLHLQLGNHSTAVDFAKESLALSKLTLPKTEAVNNSLEKLTNSLKKKKRFKEALKYASESNQIALSREQTPENIKAIADTFLWRADLKSEMQNYEEALEDYEKSLVLYNKNPEINYNLYNVHKGKLLCFQKLDRRTEFQDELDTILKISEQYRQHIREDNSRQAFFDNEQLVFDLAVTDALKQKEDRKAFKFAEISKARSLLDFVKSNKSITKLEKEFSAVAKPLSIEEIQKRMPENVQIIQYALLDGKLAIWILTKNKIDLIKKDFSQTKLDKQIRKFRKSIIEKEKATNIEQDAQELYEFLIPNNLDRNKTLCLVLDKSLHQIPFASLISSHGKYLIEDFAILYSPSSSVFVLATEDAKQKESQTEEKFLGIGNPQFDRKENPNLEDLPDARIEAETIKKNYTKSNNFIGEKATKANFLKEFENAEIIHFAGHFIINEQSPSNSKLVFADDSLHSFELSEKKLNKSKLVILSACETGYEKFNKSEGAIGIGRMFLALGTPVVIASGWKVDSEVTKDLMISFHRNRRQKGLSSINALRQTQLEILEKTETKLPYYWSAFSPNGGYSNY